MNAPASLAALLKRDYSRDELGRFSSEGDETGAGAPQPGEKFTVYRLGDKSARLENVNAGNSHAVAHHIMRSQSIDAPQGHGGSGHVITAHEITVGPGGFGAYAAFNAGQGAAGRQVGRAAGEKALRRDNQITYSFPKGADFSSRMLGSIKLKDLPDFDELGSNKGAAVLRQAFTRKAKKINLAALLKFDEDQARDESGRWTSGGGAGDRRSSSEQHAARAGSVHPNTIPRAEPGSLSDRERAVETRFANQLAQSIPAAEAAYAALPNTGGGRILNTDDVRELSADYRTDRATLSAAVHEPASYFTKEMYARRLAEAPVSNTVMFTAGGAGSGKSSAIKGDGSLAAMQDAADVVYDTNMNKFGSAVQKIDQALASGRDVQIAYVARDPVESLTLGALPRAMGSGGGRTVRLAEHVATHVGAAETIQRLAGHYADNPKVKIHYVDNRHGRGGQRISDSSLPSQLDFRDIGSRLETALKAEYDAGRISEAVYRGTKGSH